MDTSSEMIHALLPVFLVSVLGASTTSVGVIEGVGEATASITKLFSGTLSDYLDKRKLLAIVGYGLAAFTKPLFPLAASLGWVFTARFVVRIRKGARLTSNARATRARVRLLPAAFNAATAPLMHS
jgi:hypothetical protein